MVQFKRITCIGKLYCRNKKCSFCCFLDTYKCVRAIMQKKKKTGDCAYKIFNYIAEYFYRCKLVEVVEIFEYVTMEKFSDKM